MIYYGHGTADFRDNVAEGVDMMEVLMMMDMLMMMMMDMLMTE